MSKRVTDAAAAIEAVAAAARACRICRDAPEALPPLPVEPNPIVRPSAVARIVIASQAPGSIAHRSGVPFRDPSGRRLCAWMGLDEARFHDPACVAVVPMGFCYPGKGRGGDLPPRPECAPRWHPKVFGAMPQLELMLLVGAHAIRNHLGAEAGPTLTHTVRDWHRYLTRDARPRMFPMPHPSPRNNIWLRRNPWFEAEAVPALKREVARWMR